MEALTAYRHVLRAARIAFQNDAPVLAAARAQARRSFAKNRGLAAADATTQVGHAEDVARILRQNVVQARRTEADGNERWKLNIHRDTERGDNESLRDAGKKLAGVGGCGCC